MTTPLDIKEVVNNSFVNAKNKGFWDNEKGKYDPQGRNRAEMIALFHEEASELLGAVRHGNPPSDHVPEISAEEEELADLLIRIADAARGWNFSLDEVLFHGLKGFLAKSDMTVGNIAAASLRDIRNDGFFEGTTAESKSEQISVIHSAISDVQKSMVVGKPKYIKASGKNQWEMMAKLVIVVCGLAESWGYDLENAIRLKHEFNLTRKYKHGKGF